jgi:hypothetical protein
MAEDARVARGPHDKHAVHARIVERLEGERGGSDADGGRASGRRTSPAARWPTSGR